MLKLNKKITTILVFILSLAAIAGAGYFVRLRINQNHPVVNPGQNTQSDIEDELGGQILSIDTKQIVIREPDGHILDLPLNKDVVFYDNRIKPEKIISLSSFKVGDWIWAHGMSHYDDPFKDPTTFTPWWIKNLGETRPNWNY